jgi:hypothetical protein
MNCCCSSCFFFLEDLFVRLILVAASGCLLGVRHCLASGCIGTAVWLSAAGPARGSNQPTTPPVASTTMPAPRHGVAVELLMSMLRHVFCAGAVRSVVYNYCAVVPPEQSVHAFLPCRRQDVRPAQWETPGGRSEIRLVVAVHAGRTGGTPNQFTDAIGCEW